MRPSNAGVAFAHCVLGLMLVARGARQLLEAPPALFVVPTSPADFGYACGQALAIALMSMAGLALLRSGLRWRATTQAG